MTEEIKLSGRDSRHYSLPQIGIEGQKKISNSVAVVVGMGGIGCIAASYLTSSNIGKIYVCDFDAVDESNLGRQILYNENDIGRKKSKCSKRNLSKINSSIEIIPVDKRIDETELSKFTDMGNAIILDCTDNFGSRFEINKFAVNNNLYLVVGAAIRFEGQVSVFGNNYKISPCYNCLYQKDDETLEDCSGSGVLSPIPGIIGATMAAETMKIMAGMNIENNKLNIYDGLSNEWSSIKTKKRNQCLTCSI